MELGTPVGLVVGFGALLVAAVLEGGEISSFIQGTAALIVFGGTFGATLVSFPLKRVALLPRLILEAFFEKSALANAPAEMVERFVQLAQVARREGLLALEEEAAKIDDPFVKKGLLLVVDGIDAEVIEAVLTTDIQALRERHEAGYGTLEAMGGYAPTMGIIGTVMGLIHVLSSLEDPAQLGPAIAVAFVATLYGVSSANLLWIPLATKLKAKSKQEAFLRELALQGLLAIQAGDNPRIVREKLEAFLAPGHRGGAAAPGAGAPAGSAPRAGVAG